MWRTCELINFRTPLTRRAERNTLRNDIHTARRELSRYGPP
jgi:hypothetical protein